MIVDPEIHEVEVVKKGCGIEEGEFVSESPGFKTFKWQKSYGPSNILSFWEMNDIDAIRRKMKMLKKGG